jgi:Fe-S cluster biogenesis protein NfuA
MIKELLETRVRPGLQDDGGDITYLGFIDNVVFVIMKGSCSGCPSSTTTVKQGVERMLQHWIPEVNGVVAVTSEEEFEQMTSGNASSESTSTPEQTTTA